MIIMLLPLFKQQLLLQLLMLYLMKIRITKPLMVQQCMSTLPRPYFKDFRNTTTIITTTIYNNNNNDNTINTTTTITK